MRVRQVRIVLILVSLWCLAYDCYLWGGLYSTPIIGPRMMSEARLESPIAATYMFVGRQTIDVLGKRSDAAAFAAKRFPSLVSDPDRVSYMLVRRFRAAQSYWGAIAYTLAWAGLVLSFLLHFFRERRIRSFGVRD